VAEAVEQALDLGRGVMHIGYVDADKDETKWRVEKYSQHLACERCNLSFEPLNPHNYSFNSPLGWCPTCEGIGVQRGANAEAFDSRSGPDNPRRGRRRMARSGPRVGVASVRRSHRSPRGL
jgi:excinuclease UvrABC ATPase subunit